MRDRLIPILVLVLAWMLAFPGGPIVAATEGAITWTVDHEKHTITVSARLQIRIGPCGTPSVTGGAEGGPGTDGRECAETPEEIANEIRKDIERTWNGHTYRCYRLIFKVNVAPTTTRFADDRLGVVVDRSVVAIRSHAGVYRTHLGDRWNSNDPADREEPGNPLFDSTWAYPARRHTYAHEFGHLLGLSDHYKDVGWFETSSVPKPGAPVDIMSSDTDFIDQTTVDRVVERNRDRLRDTKGQEVRLEDLVCDLRFRVSLRLDETRYDASHTVNSVATAPCSRAPSTSSSEQLVQVGSQPQTMYLIEDPDIQPLGFTLVPVVDALGIIQGMSGGWVGRSSRALVELPVRIEVTRTRDRPARGDTPPVLDFSDPSCFGGDDSGTPPPGDCGRRSFDAWISIQRSAGDELWIGSAAAPIVIGGLTGPAMNVLPMLYRNCSGPDAWPGAWVGGRATQTKGRLPAREVIGKVVRDWSREGIPGRIDITGAATLHIVRPGSLEDDRLTWTLTLCPLDADDRTPPDCP